jgi:2-acylglycerol O-acyltransferase 2
LSLTTDYYPIITVKEADLPSDRKYVFGYHPHGIISMGAACTFATEATGFSKLFPGVTAQLLTLGEYFAASLPTNNCPDANFWLPLYRDILMAMGLASVSKRSCRSILKKGHSIAIVIGGASESLYAYPGTNNLTLKKRLGFIKIAIREGADLVPVYGFGENDIYELLPNDEDTLTYSIQKRFQAIFGFTFPFFHGRGVFTYNYGLMPYRRPVVVVVGKPIAVTQNAKPTDEEVQEYHRLYIEGLQS